MGCLSGRDDGRPPCVRSGNVGSNSFAAGNSLFNNFVVQNTSPQRKTIHIFHYPIVWQGSRDLMMVEGVSESDIRASLLKGELQRRIQCGDIIIIRCNIDLLQFSAAQRNFINQAYTGMGDLNGTVIRPSELSSTIIQQSDIDLIGTCDGVNQLFTIPLGTFVYQPPDYKPIVYWNGVRQAFGDDYRLGPTSPAGYSSVVLTIPPSPGDIITADYFISAVANLP